MFVYNYYYELLENWFYCSILPVTLSLIQRIKGWTNKFRQKRSEKMKKAVIIMVTVILAMFFCCELLATNLQKSIIPAEASWVIHFDLEKFAATQIGNHLLNEQDGKGEENIVACLQGNLNRDFLLELLGAEESHKEIPHGKYTIHSWDGDEYGAFASENLALIGPNQDAIKLVLDVIAGKKANIASSPMNDYIKEIPSNAFLAAMAKDISSLAEGKSKVFIIKKTESAMFSLAEIKENFNIRLNFTVKTLEDAQNMENVLNKILSLPSYLGFQSLALVPMK
jgi:BarA-like signal transduction histidine kinase